MEYSIEDFLNINVWHCSVPGYFEDYINNLTTNYYKKHVYWAQDEFEFWRPMNEENWNTMVHHYADKNIKPIILTAAVDYVDISLIPNFDPNNFYLTPWVSYWFTKTYFDVLVNRRESRPRQNHIICFPEKIHYKYKFISLNKRPRPFRCEIIDLLAREKLLENNAVTWYDPDINPGHYKFLWWKPQILQLDNYFYSSSDQGFVPDQYYESFAQLVMEADSEQSICISEKTITPLLIGKPFICASAPSFHEKLNELGFALYDEVFDYSFDLEKNRYKRWLMIIDNLKRLEEMSFDDLRSLAKVLKPKLEHNRNRAIELATNLSKNMTPQIVMEALDVFKRTGKSADDSVLLVDSIQKYSNHINKHISDM